MVRKDVFTVSNTLFSSPMENDTYMKFSKGWPPIEYILGVMEDDLKENLEKIQLWLKREQNREPERPRWTRNDERKYRSAITKLSLSNNQRIRDLEHYLSSIESLRVSMISRLELTRNELSFQSAENVRFFTYVTVVFLPLGFATAVFSMGGVSGNPELIGMIVTAVISLFLTVVALWNAKTLIDKIFSPIFHIPQNMKYRLTQHKNERATLPGNEPFGSIKTHSADGSETGKDSDKSRGMRGVLVN